MRLSSSVSIVLAVACCLLTANSVNSESSQQNFASEKLEEIGKVTTKAEDTAVDIVADGQDDSQVSSLVVMASSIEPLSSSESVEVEGRKLKKKGGSKILKIIKHKIKHKLKKGKKKHKFKKGKRKKLKRKILKHSKKIKKIAKLGGAAAAATGISLGVSLPLSLRRRRRPVDTDLDGENDSTDDSDGIDFDGDGSDQDGGDSGGGGGGNSGGGSGGGGGSGRRVAADSQELDDDDSVRSKIDPLLAALGQHKEAPPFDLTFLSSSHKKPIKSSSVRNSTLPYSDDKVQDPKSKVQIHQAEKTTKRPVQTYFPPLPSGDYSTKKPSSSSIKSQSKHKTIKPAQTSYSHQSTAGTIHGVSAAATAATSRPSLSVKGQKGTIKINEALPTTRKPDQTSYSPLGAGYSASSSLAVKGQQQQKGKHHPKTSRKPGESGTPTRHLSQPIGTLQRPLTLKGKHQQLKGDHGHDPIRPTRKPIHHNSADPVPYTTQFKGPTVYHPTTKKPKSKKRTTTPVPTGIKIGPSEYKIPRTKKPKKPSKQTIAQWIISQSKKPEEKLPSAVIWMPEVPENVNRLPPELEKYVSSNLSKAKEPNFSSRSGTAWTRQWFPNEEVLLPAASNSDAKHIRVVEKKTNHAVVLSGLRPPPDSSNSKQSSWWQWGPVQQL